MGSRKTARRLQAFVLILGAGLAGRLSANPDFGGWLNFEFRPEVAGFRQQGHVNSGPGYQIDFKNKSGRRYSFDVGAGLTEWLSVRTGIAWYQYLNGYDEWAGPSGSLGQYSRVYNYDAETPYLGLQLYPAALFGRRYSSGADNPDGVLWWPSLTAVYYRGSSSASYSIISATGIYSGATVPNPEKENQEGYTAILTVPLQRRISAWVGLDHQTWYQFSNQTFSNSYSNGFEGIHGGLTLYALLGSADPRLQIPFLGGPGALRLELNGYKENWLNGGQSGTTGYELRALYALNSLAALGLVGAQDSYPRPFINYNGFVNDSGTLGASYLGVDLTFNFGSPFWRGFSDEEVLAQKPAGPALDAWPEPPAAEIPDAPTGAEP